MFGLVVGRQWRTGLGVLALILFLVVVVVVVLLMVLMLLLLLKRHPRDALLEKDNFANGVELLNGVADDHFDNI